jgi:cytochrome bd-type quinol oxidase subunit 2
MLAGAVTGAAAVILFMEAGGKARLDSDDPGVIVALIAGLSYAVMGLGVGLGAMASRQGAVFLNVEDAQELRDERANLVPSAIGCILLGLFLIVLALAPVERGPVSQLWTVAAGSCLAGLLAVVIATRNRGDELMRQVSLEASTLTLYLAMTLLSVWGMLAHLALVPWLSPLSVIAGLMMLQLAMIFWVVGRKGMMKAR